MNVLLKLLPHNLPTFIREEILSTLFQATAEAFSFRSPRLDGAADACKSPAAASRCEGVPSLLEGQALDDRNSLPRLSFDEYLRAYALFTREQAEKALRDGRDIRALKTQLYRNAYPLGGRLREIFGVDTMEEVIQLGQILYQAIGVEVQGDPQGNVTVNRCYFSQFYSAPVCDLISALDDGVFSGLSGGGRLEFSERLTDGRTCCKAKLRSREEALR
jgi:hypothetical protein